MSESIKILIEADDQATKTIVDTAKEVDDLGKRVKRTMDGLKDPVERYTEQLEELKRAHELGSVSADEFARAEEALKSKIEGTGNAFKEVGGKAKAASEFVGVLASVSGSPEIAGLAGQFAGITEKVGAFSEVSKSGGAGALAFKGGVLALAFGLGTTLGKALGDVIFQTAKFAREMKKAQETAFELSSEMLALNNKTTELAKRDIELIRDPEKKRAAYVLLLSTLERDVQQITANVRVSEKAVADWADKWQITGERKAAAEMAQTELENDKERLKAAKDQRDAIRDLLSERTRAYELAQQENQASEEHLQRERDFIVEQLNLERELAAQKQRAADEELRRIKEIEAARQQANDNAIRDAIAQAQRGVEQIKAENQRIEDIAKSEQQRLEIRRIEIEQGKEAAKVQSLINQGLDANTAKKLAAEESALDKLIKKPERKSSLDSGISAVEGRLISRGPGQSVPQQTLEEIKQLRNEAKIAAREKREADREARETALKQLNEFKNNVRLVVAGAPQ